MDGLFYVVVKNAKEFEELLENAPVSDPWKSRMFPISVYGFPSYVQFEQGEAVGWGVAGVRKKLQDIIA